MNNAAVEQLRIEALGTKVHIDLFGFTANERDTLGVIWARCSRLIGRFPSHDEPPIRLMANIGSDVTIDPDLLLSAEGSVSGQSFDEVVDQLTSLVTREAIRRRRSELLMLHAGAVADSLTGRVVSFIGPSGRGKTTATIELGTEYGYVTDETTAITADDFVIPYPKPLSIVQSGGELFKRQTSPDALGLRTIPVGTALRIAGLAILDRRVDGPRQPALEKVNIHDELNTLVPQLNYASARPRSLSALVALTERMGGMHRIVYREADTLGAVMNDLMTRKLPSGFQRSDTADSVDTGDRITVLHDGKVMVLDGIAPIIWRTLAVPQHLDEIIRRVVVEHGEPAHGTSREAVIAAIESLRSESLLRMVNTWAK